MIVLEDKKLVIITPPHTASGNLHRALCRPGIGGIWAIGPTPDGEGYDHHVSKISEGWKDFRVAIVVRHPLDRLIGLYEHHQEEARINNWQKIPWWMFVSMVLEKNPEISWFYRTTIDQLCIGIKEDFVIRYESLQEDISKIVGFPIDIPQRWNESRDLSSFYAQIGVCCAAEWWGREDLSRFGYKSRVECNFS